MNGALGVIFLSSGSAHGGAERYQTLLASAWRGNGAAITAFISANENLDGWAEGLRGVGADVRRGFGLSRWIDELRALPNHHERIVHINGCMRGSLFQHLLAAKALGYHVILSEHGLPRAAEPVRMLRRLAPWRVKCWLKRQKKRVEWRLADATIAVSESGRQHLIDQCGMRPMDCVAIPNGTDTARYRPDHKLRASIRQRLGMTDSFIVGSVGRLDRPKGYHRLLDAVSALGNQRVCVLLVGDGPQAGALAVQSSELGLRDRIHFTGWQDDVAGYLNAMDVFVLPSDAEVMPLSILEAMSVGKPIVASAVGGISELVVDGVNGYLVPAGQTESLRNRLAHLAANPELIGRFACESRHRAECNFSQETMIARTWRLYQRVLGESRCRLVSHEGSQKRLSCVATASACCRDGAAEPIRTVGCCGSARPETSIDREPVA
ncbi:MAG: glycosyltransferase family 4 protein [Planctomycetes bacterium]|nr:glycosyltransferase family 4 protein [Planctomycetota bacterium]